MLRKWSNDILGYGVTTCCLILSCLFIAGSILSYAPSFSTLFFLEKNDVWLLRKWSNDHLGSGAYVQFGIKLFIIFVGNFPPYPPSFKISIFTLNAQKKKERSCLVAEKIIKWVSGFWSYCVKFSIKLFINNLILWLCNLRVGNNKNLTLNFGIFTRLNKKRMRFMRRLLWCQNLM